MTHNNPTQPSTQRKTFAIVSHPDAGKTTLTEKFLLFGGAIQMAGSVKARKSARHATSDWLEMEKQRGISVTTSVMQFPYGGCIMNLLDTPGHADFSEDTYRTLTAVDSALMVIDAAKGVEPRTIKLMEVCRLRHSPIMTFINKMDRDSLEPLDLLSNIESILNIECIPITWPIGAGKSFQGVYHFNDQCVYLFEGSKGQQAHRNKQRMSLQELEQSQQIDANLMQQLRDDIELIEGTLPPFDPQAYLEGKQTPVFFGSAINHFGIEALLDYFSAHAPGPQARETRTREVAPDEAKFSGFVFKIQANMDPAHRDRMAFLRIVSGSYRKGMKMHQVRTQRNVVVNNALTFMAKERESASLAEPGDIIGLHNHGNMQIGDSFTEGEDLRFVGIPNFAPELFRSVRLKDPLKQKALLKGLMQLSEEGATQLFRPLMNNQLILGAIGVLQFDVVAYRLAHEYRVQCLYEPSPTHAIRWVHCEDANTLRDFKEQEAHYLGLDIADRLCYMAPNGVNLDMAMERWPSVVFSAMCEHEV